MSDEQPPRPADDNRVAWYAYWKTRSMPWRTEPEINEDRQQYLAVRRTVRPDIERGIYPFRDANGGISLTRADVEWLLSTHESGDKRGPVDRSDFTWWQRESLDVRGAILSGVNLSRLPLSRLRAGLAPDEWSGASTSQRSAAAVHLEGASLTDSDLERAVLLGACMKRADLRGALLVRSILSYADLSGGILRWAQFQGAHLVDAHLTGTDLRLAFFDSASNLRPLDWDRSRGSGPKLASVHWGGVDLSFVRWADVTVLGDEFEARQTKNADGKRKGAAVRLPEFEGALRANRQVATVLRDQGLNEHADRFAFRAQVLQTHVLRRQRKWLRWAGSVLLGLIAGHGYRPFRSFLTYAFVNGIFATIYFLLAYFNLTRERFMSWDSPLVLSVTSFHGRVFFSGGIPLSDWVARVGATEAVVGLLIEIIFIATFTQRFFAR